MKRGVIVYIAGDVPNEWNEDLNEMINCLGVQADIVEVVASTFGSYDIHYAWWKLVSKGVQSISCKLAMFDSEEKLRFTGKELRLCG